ncbi:MAG: tryptophan--tRNA ligase [Elusimicrobia bacterium]|nr:tryptophan--tRNA ligase [Elusimicrobiota bacterium]
MTTRKRVFSGIQPSGIVHIGNYIGALKNWAAMQNDYDCLYCIVDLHAITVPQDPEDLRKRILLTAATTLAAGVDPDKCILFVQADVPEHAELSWILNCFTYFGELSQMTQFKDKSVVRGQGTSAGLFTYPCLMAADILLYDTHAVPVGDDQRQHLELTRLVARRMNKTYAEKPPAPGAKPKELFVVPEAFIGKTGARVMGLDDPAVKMSKSASSEYNYISLSDAPDVIRRKIKKAVTDSGTTIEFNEEKRPAISNLVTIYGALANMTVEQVVARYEGKGYGDFKNDLAEVAVEALAPIQQRIHEWLTERERLEKLLADGAEKARALATPKMAEVRKRIGLGR